MDHQKVTFVNRYGIALAGAVKEQCSGLYAQTMAERGFLTIAFDPLFAGESGYHARSLNSNGGWNVIGCESFMNQPINTYSNEIRSAVLIMHGEAFFNSYMK